MGPGGAPQKLIPRAAVQMVETQAWGTEVPRARTGTITRTVKPLQSQNLLPMLLGQSCKYRGFVWKNVLMGVANTTNL